MFPGAFFGWSKYRGGLKLKTAEVVRLEGRFGLGADFPPNRELANRSEEVTGRNETGLE